MKFFYRALLCSCLAVTAILVSPQTGKACDRSSLLMDSVVFDGTNYTVYATMCIGGGTLGGASGANAFTSTFAIASYGGTGTIVGFSPAALISDSTNCPLTGSLLPSPPVPSTLSGTADPATAYIGYQSLTNCPYTCISNTVTCGLPHTDCEQLVIIMDGLPDSLTAIGVEGQGNPANGCHRNFAPGYDDNITIDFTTLPVVWAGFEARMEGETVELDWQTVSESNNDYFKVMRSHDARTWEEIGTVNAVGDSDGMQPYDFTDYAPATGVNYYRIQQIDIDARFTETEIRSVVFDGSVEMDWVEIGPIPTSDRLFGSFVVEQAENFEIEVYGTNGQVVHREQLSGQTGLNQFEVDMSDYSNGIYFIRVKGSQGILERKTIKI